MTDSIEWKTTLQVLRIFIPPTASPPPPTTRSFPCCAAVCFALSLSLGGRNQPRKLTCIERPQSRTAPDRPSAGQAHLSGAGAMRTKVVKGHRKVWRTQAHAYPSHDLLLATQKKAAPAPPMSTEVVKTRNESCAMWSFWQFRPQGRGMPSQLERTSYRCNFSPRKRRGNGGRYGIHASMLQSYEIAETEVFARTKCPKKGERTRMKLLKLTQSSVPQLILAMVESSAATTVLFGHFFAPPSHNYVLSTDKLRFSEL